MYRIVTLALTVCLGLFVSTASAQQIRVGDRFQVVDSGEWKTVVVKQIRGPFIEAQLLGTTRTATLREDDLRPILKNPPRGKVEVGSRVEYSTGFAWKTGTISSIDRMSVNVQPDGGGDEDTVMGGSYRLVPADYKIEVKEDAAGNVPRRPAMPDMSKMPPEMREHMRQLEARSGRNAPNVDDMPRGRGQEDKKPKLDITPLPALPQITAVDDNAGMQGTFRRDSAPPESSRSKSTGLTPVEPSARTNMQGTIPLRGAAVTIFEQISGVFVSDNADVAAVCIADESLGSETPCTIEMIDTKQGKSVKIYGAPVGYVLMDLSPDGTRLLLGSASGRKKFTGALAVISLAGDQPTVVKHFSTGAADDNARPMPPFGGSTPHFAGNDRIAIKKSSGVVVFSADTGQQVGSFSEATDLSITEDGKLASYVTHGKITVVEINSLRTLASWSMPKGDEGSMRLSPDRRTLAVTTNGVMYIMDATTGKIVQTVSASQSGNQLGWLDSRFILLSDGRVIDTRKGMVVWKYEGFGKREDRDVMVKLSHGRLWLARINRRGNSGSLSVAELPHADLIAAADGAKREDALAVRRGDAVKLVINLQGDPYADQAEKLLTEQVRAAGLILDSSATLELVASRKTGEEVERTFGGFGRPEQKVRVKPEYVILTLQKNGEKLWEQSQGGAPTVIMVQGKESFQDAAARQSRADARSFQHMPIPGELVKKEFENGLGSSRVGG